jgi:hypothetical protein
MLFNPLIFISKGPPALSLFKLILQVPSEPVIPLLVCLPMLMVTFSPGEAVPQTGTGLFCCKTIWSPKGLVIFILASIFPVITESKRSKAPYFIRFIIVCFKNS